MPYLFRAWSPSSMSYNSHHRFAPAAALEYTPVTSYRPPENIPDMKEKLYNALTWGRREVTHTTACPFIFFTQSLLFAIQFAEWRDQKDEEQVFITVVDVSHAKTPPGHPARFYPVNEMMQRFGVEIRSGRDNSIRHYHDEFVAMDCVSLGGESRTATLQSLRISGLYRLYPAINQANEREHRRLYRTVSDLRKFGFRGERSMSLSRINAAAKVAACFLGESGRRVAPHLLAGILAPQKRQSNDSTLLRWVAIHTDEGDESTVEGPLLAPSDAPELAQYLELMQVFAHRSVNDDLVNCESSIEQVITDRDRQDWCQWKTEERREYRDSRFERNEPGGPRRKRPRPQRRSTGEKATDSARATVKGRSRRVERSISKSNKTRSKTTDGPSGRIDARIEKRRSRRLR